MGEALITRRMIENNGILKLSNARFTSDNEMTWYSYEVGNGGSLCTFRDCELLETGKVYILKYNENIIGYGVAASDSLMYGLNVGTEFYVPGQNSFPMSEVEFYEIID